MRRIPVKHKRTLHQTIYIVIGLSLLLVLSIYISPLDFSYFTRGATKIGGILTQFIHPDMSALPTFLSGMIDTLAIAFVGLLTALLFALPISFLVAHNTTPVPMVAKGIKLFLTLIRAVPITIWGLIGAASIGFGAQAGVLGLFLPTFSYLVRVLSERIEEGGSEIVEAMKACGAPWIVAMFKGVVIQIMPQLISTIMLRFELTVNETIALGMVGIAGVGYTLNMAIGTYKFSVAIVGIALIYLTMLLVETVSRLMVQKIRREK